MDKKKPVMVKIEWVDAQSVDMGGIFTAKDLERIDAPIWANIVGWLVKKDKENYYVAAEYWEDHTPCFKYLHIIPRRSVTAIRRLKEVK